MKTWEQEAILEGISSGFKALEAPDCPEILRATPAENQKRFRGGDSRIFSGNPPKKIAETDSQNLAGNPTMVFWFEKRRDLVNTNFRYVGERDYLIVNSNKQTLGSPKCSDAK